MKKTSLISAILSVILIVSMCIPPVAAANAQAKSDDATYYFGDLNTDGEIDKFDYIIVKRHCLKTITLNADQLIRGDVNQSGVIDKFDYILVKRHCLKTYIILSPTVTKHDVQSIAAKDATCTENGNIAYFYCKTCNKYFSDKDEENEISLADTVVRSSGHRLEFVPEKAPVDSNDAGNCDYWRCEICKKCFLDEKATKEIPFEDIAWNLFKITYYCDETKLKQTKWYKVGTEVEELLDPEIHGYEFKYWIDGNGKRINSVSASNTENIELYAVVELETYTIYLGGTWKTENLTYTVKDQIDLPSPVEDGLTFAGWRDSEGKVEEYVDSVGIRRWRIPKGTYGDIELMAQWKDNRNLIVPDTRPAQDRYVDSGYDEAEKHYWFLYSLGEIRNVVLDPDSDLVKTGHNGGFIAGSLTLAETLTVEESVGKSVSETVSHTVTKSTDWSITDSWEQSASAGVDVSVTVGAEVGPDFAKTKVEAAIGVSCEVSSSVGGSITGGGSDGESDESSNTIETNFAYNTSISQSKERTISFSHEVAPGNYYYANVGTVKVYAFVVFDPVTNTFGLETFSVLEKDTTTAVLSDKKDGREYVSDNLSYSVHIDGINNEVNGNYFVQYFANDRTDESVVKMYPIDSDAQIAYNPFAYTGYTFVNWETADGVIYKEGQSVKNLAERGQILILNAQWDANAYTVNYNANTPSNASNSVINIPESISAIYDKDITLGSAPSLIGWTFGGWYRDADCTDRVGNANEITSNLTSDVNGSVTLYAKWTANTYTVFYNANGGSGTTMNSYHSFDSASLLSENGYSRTNYTFLGWSTKSDAKVPDFKNGESAINMTDASGGTVTLYAVWIKTTARVDFTSSNGTRDKSLVEGDRFVEKVGTLMDKSALLANGYDQIKITVVFDAKREAIFSYNNAELRLLGINNTVLGKSVWDLGGDFNRTEWTSNITRTYTVNILSLNDDGSFYLEWSNKDDNTLSTGEKWYLGETNVTVTVIQ